MTQAADLGGTGGSGDRQHRIFCDGGAGPDLRSAHGLAPLRPELSPIDKAERMSSGDSCAFSALQQAQWPRAVPFFFSHSRPQGTSDGCNPDPIRRFWVCRTVLFNLKQ